MLEHVVSLITGILGGILGAVAAFFTLKQKVSSWIETTEVMVADLKEKIVTLEDRVGRVQKTVEEEAVSISECHSCKEKWETKIDAYHLLATQEAKAIRELAASEMSKLNIKLDHVTGDTKDTKEALRTIADRQVELMIGLGVRPEKRKMPRLPEVDGE